MSIESLKRVLMSTKAEARAMRKGNLDERLNPKPKEEALPVLQVDDDMEAAPAMSDAGDTGSKKMKREKEIAAIKKLLANS